MDYILIFLGLVLIILGIIMFIFPPIPGWLLILLGILLIGPRSKIGKKIYNLFPESIRKYLDKKLF